MIDWVVVEGICGSVLSVAGLGWWLSGRFRAVETSLDDKLAKHEEMDRERHLENLERFRHISVALTRLGYKNIVP